MKGFLILLCLVLSAPCFAQPTAHITGRVLDAGNHQPIEYATIAVENKATQKLINGAVSDSMGSFTIKDVSPGTYRIIIEFIGYTKKTIDSLQVNAKNISVGTVYLSANGGQTLKDVTVTAKAPVVENKIDKLVYNVENDITSQGGQALDVLKKVPQVNVDLDGNVELLGNSNIRFLINGKPSSVFGNSVADALAAIPASQIKSIEVITSPGAKYDAQGTGGIINIILKESKMQGINGSINASIGSRLENGSANLNYRRNNFGLNAYFNANAQLKSRTLYKQDRASLDIAGDTNHLVQDGYYDFHRTSYSGGLGMDWDLDKQNTITAAISYSSYEYTSEEFYDVQQDTAGDIAPPIKSQRNAYSHFEDKTLDWSLDYKKKFKKEGQELEFLYSASYGEPGTAFTQTSNYKGQSWDYQGATSNNPGVDRENNFSLDYTQPLKGDVEIETGVKAIFQSIYSSAVVTALQPGTDIYYPVPGQSYGLNYDMNIYAGYLSASFPVFHFLKVKAGARYEHTDTRIDFPNTSIPAYGTLVPSVTISHDLKEGQFVKLSYSRRIERADYHDINPFLNFKDPYNISTGNPLLQPEIGDNIELGYNRSLNNDKGNIYISLIERINSQDHKWVTTFYPDFIAGDSVYHDISVTKPENVGIEYNTGVNLSGSYTVKDKLNFRANISFFHRHSVGFPTDTYNPDGNRLRANLNISYQLPHDFITEIFGNYNSPSNNIQGKSPQWFSYTIAFRKQFWNKNASLGLTATDIFNEYIHQVTTVDAADYSSVIDKKMPHRSVGISFTYKFGKLEFKKDREDDSNMNSQQMSN